jgi:hypothetical protein
MERGITFTVHDLEAYVIFHCTVCLSPGMAIHLPYNITRKYLHSLFETSEVSSIIRDMLRVGTGALKSMPHSDTHNQVR